MDDNMLDNIQQVMVFMRYDIRNPKNVFWANTIKATLENSNSNDEMINFLCNGASLDDRNIKLKKSGLLNSNRSSLSNDEKMIVEKVLGYAFTKIEYYISQDMFEMAYDIVDAIHVFPELFVSSNTRNLKKYWKIYIKPLQKKWNNKIFDEFKYIFK